MGFGDIVLETFEIYNQPLNEDPDTADLIGPAMVAMQREEDFMEHVKLTIIAILGRKDLHKFQNMIEDGRAPSFDLPDSKVTLSVEPTSAHEGYIPDGATPITVKSGHLQVLDWVNWWMFNNSPRPYRPCPFQPTMDQDDFNDGLANSYVTGVVSNVARTGYHVVVVVYRGGDNPEYEEMIVEDITIPLSPGDTADMVYYSLGLLVPPDEEDWDSSSVDSKFSGGIISSDEPASSVCVNIPNPTARVDGAGGFVWKPVSEARGTPVVLFPAGSPSGPATFNGESGYYRGLTNGGRPTTYFSKQASEYVAGAVCSGTGGSDGTAPGDEIEMCGVEMTPCTMDVGFGEESGELITFPPLPIRADNQNFYEAFDDQKVHDIKRLANLFEIKAERLVDDIMEDEEMVGEEDKIDDIYINFGTRIHDNKKASCRYLYLFCEHVFGMANQAGNGFSSACEGHGVEYGLGAQLENGLNCNIISVTSQEYYYEFGFTHVEQGVGSIGEIMEDENLREQYEDRQRTGKAWYLSSSPGDGSAGEEYEQPDSAEDYYTMLVGGETSGEHNIVFYECLPSGEINTYTIFGFMGRMKIVDHETGINKFVQMNTEDPNSIMVPYIPAIGEVLTNHELADCFLSGLVISILVADVTVKSLPWWAVALIVVSIIVIAWTGYGAAMAGEFVAFFVKLIVGYIIGAMVAGIAAKYGAAWGAAASLIAMIVAAMITRGTSLGTTLANSVGSLATMSLQEILLGALNLVTNVSKMISAESMAESRDEFEASRELYDANMLELKEDEQELMDEMGGFVGIEPLLDNLLETSIRTVVNPMSASDYFDMYDGINDVGTDMTDTDGFLEDPFNMDRMLSPA